MGCRLPGGVDGPGAYWDLLVEGRDALVDVPPDRWQVEKFYDPDLGPGTSRVRRGGFLADPVDEFDATFFGISPREADHVDPQQRLLLEVAWEALEDAGATLDRLAGSDTGVFMGGFTLDYSQLQFAGAGASNLAAHTATGVVMTMLANRISHAFDFVGPSMSVDTACSSSLVAVHLACRSLWSGETSVALAGGVNLMLSPNFTIAASQGGFLSPTSRSRAFDAEADGYVRGEGAGVVVLKPLSAALQDGDRVYALIRGTAVNQDGRTNGITVPNGESQARAIRTALANAGVAPSSVSYVEAHGTGTALGDPIEANAIGEVYGAGRSAEAGCLMTSVKTNIGHLEAAAGVAGLMKAVLCLTHRQVPPHLHLTAPNPGIDLDALGLRIPTVSVPLAERDGVVHAAVNSFGFGGTNAHVVLESAPAGAQATASEDHLPPEPLVSVFPLTARGAGALADLAGRYLEALQGGDDPATLASTTAHRRTHHRQARLAVVTDSAEELHDALASVRDEQPHPAVHLSAGPATDSPPAFVYTGMGPQWWGMGRQLLTTNRVFREAIERTDAALGRLADWSLVDELRVDEPASRMARAAVSQPANFALQVALTELWSSLGITPGAIVGHSAGEVAAAYAAGALTFDDAVTVIYHRARLQDLTRGQGRLIAVAVSAEEAMELPAVRAGRLTIAAVNGPTSVAFVGTVPDLEKAKASLDEHGVFCRFVDGDVPYHSPAMDPLEAELRQCLDGLAPLAPATPLYSTVTGGELTGPAHDAEYWWRNVREPVRFGDAALAMIDEGSTSFVEIGPHPVLGHTLAECLRSRGRRGFSVPSLRRDGTDGTVLTHSCAELYVAGHSLDWEAFHPRAVSRPLPSYPWQRERFWTEAAQTRRDRLGELDHPLLGGRSDSAAPAWRRYLDGSRPAYLADHRVMDANVFPGAGYVEMALAAGKAVFGADQCVVERVRFDAPVVLRPGTSYVLDTTLDRATGAVEINGRQPESAEWVAHASARLAPAAASVPLIDLEAAKEKCDQEWDREKCYETFRSGGFDYGPAFQSIDRLWLGEREAVSRLVPEASTRDEADGLVLDPIVLDGCFQTLLPLVGASAGAATLLPIGADKIVVHGRPSGELWAYATATGDSDEELTGDVVLVDDEGRAIVEVRGFRVKVVGAGHEGRGRLGNRWLHELVWQPTEADPDAGDTVEPGTWVVLADRRGLADELVSRLSDAGHDAILAHRGTGFRMVGTDEFEVRPDTREDIESLVRAVAARTDRPIRGIVHLWSGDASTEDLGFGTLSWPMNDGPLSVLNLVQTLDAEGVSWPLVLVTVGAQPVDGRVGATGLLQSPLWGMGRVLHQESLSLNTRLMDLDPDRPLDDIPALATEILGTASEEDQVAWRAGERLVARLQPSRRESGSVPATFRPDASYLITGGLGALGLLSARWMAERGARRIILMARSPLPARDTWADLSPLDPSRAHIEAIAEIEACGATVETVSLDVADPRALRAFVEERRRQSLPPVRGVVHSAGAVKDQVMVQMTTDQMETVLRPKVLGAWSLHEALADEALDFFVLYSSVSSVVATTGQGNYAAGNAFLDALAYYRRGRGLPALSVNWGPWDVGMIAQLGLQPFYARRGLDLITESTGMRIFGELLGSAEAQQVVASAHWPTLIASYPIVPRLIEHLAADNDHAAGDGARDAVSVGDRLAAAAPEEHPEIIAAACAEIIAAVLRLRPDKMSREESLNQLGLDSMIAIEVRIRLEQAFGVAPKAVFLLQGTTVAEVAELIHAERLAEDAAQGAAESAGGPVPDTPESLASLLDELDSEDAEALLAEVELPATKESDA